MAYHRLDKHPEFSCPGTAYQETLVVESGPPFDVGTESYQGIGGEDPCLDTGHRQSGHHQQTFQLL